MIQHTFVEGPSPEAELLSTSNNGPTCKGEKVTFICNIFGTRLFWYINGNLVKDYSGNDVCGEYEELHVQEEELEVFSLLARNFNDPAGHNGYFNCTSILDITSSTAVKANVTCSTQLPFSAIPNLTHADTLYFEVLGKIVGRQTS